MPRFDDVPRTVRMGDRHISQDPSEELASVRLCLRRLSERPQDPARRLLFWKLVEMGDRIREERP